MAPPALSHCLALTTPKATTNAAKALWLPLRQAMWRVVHPLSGNVLLTSAWAVPELRWHWSFLPCTQYIIYIYIYVSISINRIKYNMRRDKRFTKGNYGQLGQQSGGNIYIYIYNGSLSLRSSFLHQNCSNETMASRIGTAQSDYDLLELPEKVVWCPPGATGHWESLGHAARTRPRCQNMLEEFNTQLSAGQAQYR